MANYVEVNPNLIRWAVNRSGLKTRDFKQPVGEWISGDEQPTFSKLEAFTRKAMVPFGYLFLDEPPVEQLPVPDYRTRGDDGVARPSPNLLETIYDMQRRQQWMREYLIEEHHAALDFVGAAKVGLNEVKVANAIRNRLDLKADWARRLPSTEEALRHLRARVEQIGILIFINGIVGNATNRSLSPEEFQGFVFADEYAPTIFVNGADAKAAQMFTIAHELVHVWIGKSALFNDLASNETNVRQEMYCNAVAAEFLVPGELFGQLWDERGEVDDDSYRWFGRYFKVSPIVAARRAKDLKYISADAFFAFYRRYMDELHKVPKKKATGGSFWNNQNTRLGSRFGKAVISAAREGRLSYSEAYDLTGLYGKSFDKYASLVHREAGV